MIVPLSVLAAAALGDGAAAAGDAEGDAAGLTAGLADGLAAADGAAVIEWPERLDGRLPRHRLDVEIALSQKGEARDVTLAGHGAWEGRGLEFGS